MFVSNLKRPHDGFLSPKSNIAKKMHNDLKLLLGLMWHAVAQLVEALRYKPEGRGFDSR